MMATKQVSFEKVEEYFRKKRWKYWTFWKNYRYFIKPSDPNERPKWITVDDEGYVDKDEFDRIKP